MHSSAEVAAGAFLTALISTEAIRWPDENEVRGFVRLEVRDPDACSARSPILHITIGAQRWAATETCWPQRHKLQVVYLI